MDSIQKSGRRLKGRSADDTILSILEKFRQSRSAEDPRTKAKQVKPLRPPRAYAYGSNPCDLDRIAQAESRIEVLDILNQVLQVLHRSGRMAEVPEALRIDCLTTSHDLQAAMKSTQDAQSFMEKVDWNSDAMLVLRAILTAANEKFRDLRLQK
jgi:hypothetical protein